MKLFSSRKRPLGRMRSIPVMAVLSRNSDFVDAWAHRKWQYLQYGPPAAEKTMRRFEVTGSARRVAMEAGVPGRARDGLYWADDMEGSCGNRLQKLAIAYAKSILWRGVGTGMRPIGQRMTSFKKKF